MGIIDVCNDLCSCANNHYYPIVSSDTVYFLYSLSYCSVLSVPYIDNTFAELEFIALTVGSGMKYM